MTLPMSKPQLGSTNWHPSYYNMVDLWNGIDERIRDLIGATIVAGLGLDMVVNDAGDTVTLNNTSLADSEAIQDLLNTTLTEGDNITLTYDDTAGTITISATGGGSSSAYLADLTTTTGVKVDGRMLAVGEGDYNVEVASGVGAFVLVDKTTTARDGSTLYRVAGVVRCEIGLPGDTPDGNDRFHLKMVSGVDDDNLTFLDALIGETNGKMWAPVGFGVGTIPTEKLHVAAASTGGRVLVKGENTAGSGSASAGMVFQGRNGAFYTVIDTGLNGSLNWGLMLASGAPLIFADGSSRNIGINNDSPATAIDVNGALTLRNVAVPATPSSAIVLYSESGVLKAKDPSGTVTTIGSGGGSYTDEQVQDVVAAFAKSAWGIGRTYDDAGNVLKFNNRYSGSIPADHGVESWTVHPDLATSSSAPTAGVIYLTKFRVFEDDTIGNIMLLLSGTWTSPTNCYCAIFNTSGTRLAVTANEASNFTNGTKTLALTSSASVTGDTDYVFALLVGGGTAIGNISRASASAMCNFGLTLPAFRIATFGTGQTSIPSSIDFSTVGASSNLVQFFAGFKS